MIHIRDVVFQKHPDAVAKKNPDTLKWEILASDHQGAKVLGIAWTKKTAWLNAAENVQKAG